MTNEEKTKELADFLYFKLSHIDYGTLTEKLLEMAEWKDEQFWLYQNIEQIIKTYKSFPDRSCPSELVKKRLKN